MLVNLLVEICVPEKKELPKSPVSDTLIHFPAFVCVSGCDVIPTTSFVRNLSRGYYLISYLEFSMGTNSPGGFYKNILIFTSITVNIGALL